MTLARLVAAVSVVALSFAVPALATADQYALIVTGASGGDEHAWKFDELRRLIVQTLRERFTYPDDHVIVLAEQAGPGVRQVTRDGVRSAMAELAKRTTPADVVLILLVGHGTVFTGADAKFNLVGPDLTAAEWAALVKPVRGRVVFVNTASGSYPFLQALAAEGRVVVTATESMSQVYATAFPEFFVRAFVNEAADLDKNGRVSIWEAFTWASAGVRTRFTEQGRLTTERSLLDDTGKGIGREAGGEGFDGALAQVTYLEPDRAPTGASTPASGATLDRRAALTSQIELLRARRESMPPEEYEKQIEALLLELARIDRLLRRP
jgi:hypothetical protein